MPSAETAESYLGGFQRLGNGILLYRPSEPSSNNLTKSPTLVILATWFSALPRHISRYTETYKSLFPGASILVLQTSIPDMVYRPYSTQQANLAPAIPILVEHATQPDHEILLHLFSNSGAHTASQIARAYRSSTGSALQVGALILDSAPGINTYRGITDGFISGLPSTPVLKQALSLAVYGLVGLITLKEMATGEEHFIQKLRQDLNDEKVLRSDRGRLYVYSKNDAIVAARDVESHAREAQGRDVELVRLEVWETSGHVGHMGKDRERYWNAVRTLWGGAGTPDSKL